MTLHQIADRMRDEAQLVANLHNDLATSKRLLELADALDAEQENAVLAEVHRARAKFPTWPTDPLHALAVLGEEFGELTKAVMHVVYEPDVGDTAREVREEAVQTAAMALRFVASLGEYVYRPGEQHQQENADAR